MGAASLPLGMSVPAHCPGCFALADCNNFYASCEAVFRPDLARRPTVVLGNNDGNIIARSAAAKALGIPMGAPLYQIAHLVEKHQVAVCSANFALYGDLSRRVHSVLGGFTPRLDIYSIDEAFLDMSGVPPLARAVYATRIRRTVARWTGIPISIGVAPTKTLAKIAAEVAKHHPEGVSVLGTSAEIAALLATLPVEEVWGIGPRRGVFLRRHGIATAGAFAEADLGWVRRHLSVVGARTLLELRGISCLPLELPRTRKQQLCCSRSFGQPITCLAEMREAVALYASWAAEKLRRQDSAATRLTVFVATNPFRRGEPQYHNSLTLALGPATSDTAMLIAAARRALARIWREGYNYHKAGVVLGGFVPASPVQLSLFEPETEATAQQPLMEAMDAINARFGRDTLRFGATGLTQPWRMRQAHRSPRYTTRWDELARVR